MMDPDMTHMQKACMHQACNTSDANRAQKVYADSLTKAMLEQQQYVIHSFVVVVGTAVTEIMTSDLGHVLLPAQRQVVSKTLE